MNEVIDTQKVGRKIPGKQLLTYGIMYGSNNITNVAKGLYLTLYLLDYFQLQYDLFILANLLFIVYNVLNNIVFSVYADKPR